MATGNSALVDRPGGYAVAVVNLLEGDAGFGKRVFNGGEPAGAEDLGSDEQAERRFITRPTT